MERSCRPPDPVEALGGKQGTVELAYEQLLSEGYIESVPYKGFFVAQIDELYHLKKDKPQPRGKGRKPADTAMILRPMAWI